jgi:hypothetical protein
MISAVHPNDAPYNLKAIPAHFATLNYEPIFLKNFPTTSLKEAF